LGGSARGAGRGSAGEAIELHGQVNGPPAKRHVDEWPQESAPAPRLLQKTHVFGKTAQRGIEHILGAQH